MITPRLTGRAAGMNAVAIFVGILFFGWLWGVMGMLLAIPLLTAIKAACACFENLRTVSEMLSD